MCGLSCLGGRYAGQPGKNRPGAPNPLTTTENYLRGVTPDGEIFDFALNAIERREGEEFAGATFTPDGKVRGRCRRWLLCAR